MRTLKELYELVYKHIVGKQSIHSLCWTISDMFDKEKFMEEEYIMLSLHFSDQRPTVGKHPQFYSHSAYHKALWNNFWWEYTKDGTEQRIKFIKYLIEQQ